MNLFWYYWSYYQLDKKPNKEEESAALSDTLDDAMETPPEFETMQTAKMLQSRIGNQAIQQLMEMKATQTGSIGGSEKHEPTAEEKLAIALARFLPTLATGGGAVQWVKLDAAFNNAAIQEQEDVLRAIVDYFPSLSETSKKAFMKNLMSWQKKQGSRLANLLWLRLARFAHISEPEISDENDN